jgi:hypothetical protein
MKFASMKALTDISATREGGTTFPQEGINLQIACARSPERDASCKGKARAPKRRQSV